MRRGPLQRALALLVGAAAFVGVLVPQAASAASPPLRCDQGTLYGIDNSRRLAEIDLASGTATIVKTYARNLNALGISDGGTHAYAFSSGGTGGTNILEDYDPTTGGVTEYPGIDTSASAIRGAVNPANGLFYYAVNTPTSTGQTDTYLGAFDPMSGAAIGQVGVVRLPAAYSGGDMAFSRSGVLYFAAGRLVYRVDDPVPSTSGTTVLHATLLLTLPVGTSPGLAFAGNGYLYAATGSTLRKIDPTTGSSVATLPLSAAFTANDLGGCSYPDTFTASIAVTDRLHDTDQWQVSLSGGSAWPAGSTSATTSGTSGGVQPQTAGPVLVVGGGAYTATETMTSGDPGDYDTTWRCAAAGTELSSGSGTTATATAPASGVNGAEIDCRFTNALRTAPVTFGAVLSAPRWSDADQLALAVHRGDAAQAVLAAATTTGAGIGLGEASTGPAAATVRRDVVLTADAASGSASAFARYTASVTCIDVAGIQSGLPTGAPFTGAVTLTPVPGSRIGCTLTLGRAAGIGVTVASPEALTVGVEGRFVIAATNAGGRTGTAAVAVQLPAGTAFLGAAGSGWACTADGARLVRCAGPDVAPGASASVALRVLPAPSAAGAPATLRASVDPTGGGAPADPSSCAPGSACATGSALVRDGIDLALAVTGPAALLRGVPARYTATVRDRGTGPAGTATVAARLPAGVRLLGAEGADCRAAGRTVTCSVPGPIPVDGDVSFTLDVRAVTVQPSTGVLLVSAVDGSGGGLPASPSRSCSSASCSAVRTPVRTPSLRIAVALGEGAPARLHAHDRVRYVYSVANAGPAALTRIRLADGTICPAESLAAGARMTCTSRDHAVIAAEVARGTVVRRGVATASVVGCTGTACRIRSNHVTAVASTTASSRLTLTQTVVLRDRDGDHRADAGERAVFRSTVRNTGTIAVTGLRVHGGLTDLGCPRTTLAPGLSVVCSATRVLRAGDAIDDRVANTATARGTAGRLGAVASAPRTAALLADAGPEGLAATGVELLAPAGTGLLLLVAAAVGGLVLRRRTVRLRRR